MTAFVRRTDHVEAGLARRAMPFQIPSVANVMIPLFEECGRIEAAAWQIFDARFISKATGHALALLGRLVGELDRGDGTEAYRRRISLKLRALLSHGTRLDFAEVLAILAGTTWSIAEAEGWALVTQTDATLIESSTLANILHVASADGVLVHLATNENAAAAFEWPSADGDEAGSAWDSADGAETGAPWQGMRVS